MSMLLAFGARGMGMAELFHSIGPMLPGVPLRTEHICLIYPQIWLKLCLNIVEYRLGKYQDMHWPVGAPVLPGATPLITSGGK